MNILFVTPRIPYPPDTGAKIRTFNLLKQARAGGENQVSLLSFIYSDTELEGVKKIKELGIEVVTVRGQDRVTFQAILKAVFYNIPLTIAKYHRGAMVFALKDYLSKQKVDVVHFDHIHMGQYLKYVKPVPVVVDEHNVEWIIYQRCCENKKGLTRLLWKIETEKMAFFEKRLCNQASCVTFVSDTDRNILEHHVKNQNTLKTIENGVDTDFFSAGPEGGNCSEEDSLVFTGSMDWYFNEDAVVYFFNEVLPLIWSKKKDVRFYIVGRNPSSVVTQLQEKDKRIVVTGMVPDVRPYIRKAKVVVIPLRFGGGTRLKILEALSMKKALVSTTLGAEGLDVENGCDLMIADSPIPIAENILHLLQNDNMRKNLGESGRNLVESQYDWKIIGSKLNAIYKEMRALVR